MHVYKDIMLCLLRVTAFCAVAVIALEDKTHDVNPRSASSTFGNTLQDLLTNGEKFGSIISTGKYCKLQVPYTMFDFSVPDEDLNVNFNTSLSEYVRFNLCRPLAHICADENGSAVCLHMSMNYELKVGNYPPKVSLKDNDVLIKYVGDRCNSTHNYTTVFELKCDPDEEHTFSIKNEEFITNFCELYFVFKTAHVCQKQPYDCSIREQDQTYSLSRLRNMNENYIVTINRTLSVAVNVCHNLVSLQMHQVCGYKSAICLMDQSKYYDNIKYKSLGNIENRSGITYSSDGAIKITYENGQVCDTDTTKRFRSTIKFLCDMEAKKGYAEYVGGLESCDLLFVWKSAAACSEEKLVNASLATRKPCGITDPIDGYVYDFSAMHQENMHYLDDDHDDYQFSICTGVKSDCPKGSGVCKKIYNGTNLRVSDGMANSRLLWSGDGLYLNYTDGDQCSNGQHRHSLIKFSCAQNIAAEFDENQCSTTINFMTYTACPDLTCSKFRHTAFDSMMNSTVAHQITRNNSVFSFNICLSLDPLEYFYCKHGGAGLCKTTRNVYSEEKETSLGFPDPLPIVVDNVTTALNFVNGSACGKLMQFASQISLICDIDITESFPDLVKYEFCIYYFEWRSRQSCGIVDFTMNTDCSIESHLGQRWNLTPLYDTLIYGVSSSKRNSTYVIDICVTSKDVRKSSIFANGKSFGKLRRGSIDYANDMTLKFYFDNGTPCANGSSKAKSVLYLICDETHDLGKPALLWEEECSVAFEWRTRLVCSPTKKLTPRRRRSKMIGFKIFSFVLLLGVLLGGFAYFLKLYPHYRERIIDFFHNIWNRFVLRAQANRLIYNF